MSSKEIFFNRDMYKIFMRYSALEKAVVFGSFAKGTFRRGSDIDIGLYIKSEEQFKALKIDINNLNLPYNFDILDYYNSDEGIKSEIERGVIIFEKIEEPNLQKLYYKYINFERALFQLEEIVLKEVTEENRDYIGDAVIKRFEFTYDTAWKLLKAYLNYMEIEAMNSPKKIIRTAYGEKLLDNYIIWEEMGDSRNETSHNYSEIDSYKIENEIRYKYVKILKDLDEKMRLEIEKEKFFLRR